MVAGKGRRSGTDRGRALGQEPSALRPWSQTGGVFASRPGPLGARYRQYEDYCSAARTAVIAVDTFRLSTPFDTSS